ncbi:MAG: class I SAM-dependent methyltransferase [Cyanobium sp.]
MDPNPSSSPSHSVRRLNQLAASLGCRSYLEIGVETGATLLQVAVEQRTGVDPSFAFDWQLHHGRDGLQLHRCTSDVFFAELEPSTRYDLIFLDGLHTFDQTYRDILHALRHSHPGTVILIDDTFPSDVFSACRDQQECLSLRAQFADASDMRWHGDTYKVVPLLALFHCDFRLLTLVDVGNPQTLLWRPLLPGQEDAIRTMQAMWAVQNLAAADYLWLLANLSLYNLIPEVQGLQELISSITLTDHPPGASC